MLDVVTQFVDLLRTAVGFAAHIASAVVQLAGQFFPKFLAIFGIVTGLVEFWIRDREKERLRDGFVRAWYRLDRMGSISLNDLVRRPAVKRTIVVAAAIVIVASSFAAPVYALSQLTFAEIQESIADILDFLIFMMLFLPMIIATNMPFFLLTRRRVQRYIDGCLRKKSPLLASFWLGALPISFNTTIMLFDNDVLSTAEMLSVGLTMSYLGGVWLVYSVLMLAYGLARLTLFLFERLCLRVAEATRGPVLVIAATIAIVGVLLDVITAPYR